MKKMMAVLLCLCMAVSLAAPAFATEGTDAALLADVLAAVEIAEEADVLLTEEKTDDNIPNTEDDPDKNNTGSGDEGGDETTKTPEDSTDEGGDEGDGEEEPAFTVPASGSLTETITWAVDENYVLTITGTGAMPDYGSISGAPWYGCFDKLTAIVVGEGVTAIGANNFAYCSAVTSVTLPAGLESIGDSAFRGMEKLETLSFPASLKTVEKFAFAHNNLKTIDLPDGIETLGDSAFNPSAAITEITLPGSLTTMGEGVFAVCNALKTITVGEGIKALGTCFINCYGVTTLNLPSTIETLNHNFIAGLGDTAALETVSVADKVDGTAFLHWKDEAGNTYTNGDIAMGAAYEGDLTAVWKNGEEDAPTSGDLTDTIRWEVSNEGILIISGTGVMPDNESPWKDLREKITAIEVGEGITDVGKHSFRDCDAAKTVSLPSTIQTLGANSLPCNLQSVTVTEKGGRKLMSWKQNRDDIFYTSQLPSLSDYDTLTAHWRGFSDVAATDWFYDYVMYCYDEGIMNGVGDGAFDPYGGATRAQVVTVLYRLAGEPTGAADSSFSDVPEGQWFTEAVNWAAANGITKGYEDGTFNPYGYVTREEFLVFLNRFTVNSIWGKQLNKWSELYDLSEWGVSDADSISDWALEAETWSYIIGLQTGYDNGDETYSLNPRSYITRAELATFQSRYATNLVLYTYAESSQYMVGYPPSVAVNAFKTEPDEKLEVEEDLEAWCFYDKGVALLVDYSESSKGKIVDWAYTDML